MSALRKLLVTALMASTFIVGPLLAVAAGMALFSSASSLMVKRFEKVGTHKTAKVAGDVKPPHDREPIGIRQQLELLATTLALLKPVPIRLPAGEDISTYLRDAIVWHFDSTACRTVVNTRQVLSGIV